MRGRGGLGTLLRFAASLAFAICSRKAWDEFCLGEVAVGLVAAPGRVAAFALASCSLKATEELGVLRVICGVFLAAGGVATGVVAGGEMA